MFIDIVLTALITGKITFTWETTAVTALVAPPGEHQLN